MLIDIYADVVCPWCYIGEKRLEKALALRPDLTVERRWRPFQLQPGMPEGGLPWSEFARRKFGGEENMKAAFTHVRAAGSEDGLRFDFDSVASAPNTVDAHRLILFAAERGLQWETANSLFEAYFAGGKDLNDREELVTLTAGTGLDIREIRAYLASEEDVAEVVASQREAHRFGVQGVPFYVFDGGRCAVSGAQPVEVFLEALGAAEAEHAR